MCCGAESPRGPMPGGRVAGIARQGLSLLGCAVIGVLSLAAPAPAQDMGPPAPRASTESRGLGMPSGDPGATRPASPRGAEKAWVSGTTLPLAAVLALVVGGGLAVRVLARGQGSLRARLGAGGRSPSGILEVLGR